MAAVRFLTALALFAQPTQPPGFPEPPLKVAVLSIDLNNLHKTTPDTAMAGRIDRLAAALRARLAAACGYQVVGIDSAAEATAHLTDEYFYEHPD
ncbi:MAG TPA: hypothetical protein VLD58_15880, partial [Gemmatimonadales bacterium]|nr:hypothetical protein [Gemmatimonadales bacterium]